MDVAATIAISARRGLLGLAADVPAPLRRPEVIRPGAMGVSGLTGELADQLLPALRQLQHRDQLAPLAVRLPDRPDSEPALASLKIVGMLARVVLLDHHRQLHPIEVSCTPNPAQTSAWSPRSEPRVPWAAVRCPSPLLLSVAYAAPNTSVRRSVLNPAAVRPSSGLAPMPVTGRTNPLNRNTRRFGRLNGRICATASTGRRARRVRVPYRSSYDRTPELLPIMLGDAPGLGVGMVKGVGRIGGGDLKVERHALRLLDDRHEHAVGLCVQSRVTLIPSLVR